MRVSQTNGKKSFDFRKIEFRTEITNTLMARTSIVSAQPYDFLRLNPLFRYATTLKSKKFQ